MPLLYVVGTLLLVGVLLWGVTALPFIDAGIKRLIQVIVVVVAALWVISLFFPVGSLSHFHVGR
jgi:hypothetical protein